MAAYDSFNDLYSDFDDRILSGNFLELVHDVSGCYDISEFNSPFDLLYPDCLDGVAEPVTDIKPWSELSGSGTESNNSETESESEHEIESKNNKPAPAKPMSPGVKPVPELKSSDCDNPDIHAPSGRCEHYKSRIDCWECNPCTLCPKIKWKGLLRPSPRNKHHIKTAIHRDMMNAKVAPRRDSNDTLDIQRTRPEQRKKCGHGVRLIRCWECNPCPICYDPINDIAPANTLAHQKSYSHVVNAIESGGFW